MIPDRRHPAECHKRKQRREVATAGLPANRAPTRPSVMKLARNTIIGSVSFNCPACLSDRGGRSFMSEDLDDARRQRFAEKREQVARTGEAAAGTTCRDSAGRAASPIRRTRISTGGCARPASHWLRSP